MSHFKAPGDWVSTRPWVHVNEADNNARQNCKTLLADGARRIWGVDAVVGARGRSQGSFGIKIQVQR
jgi:hypothetical protein